TDCQRKYESGKVEIYDHVRYYATTGHRLDGTPPTVNDRQTQLETVYRCVFDGAPPKKSLWTLIATSSNIPADEDLLALAMAASNGDKFRQLWAGDTSGHEGDDSAADLALCNLLAFWTDKDADRIDRLFRRSGLMRSKWDERHASDGRTYGQMTVGKAITG